jgi:hypothetical protein
MPETGRRETGTSTLTREGEGRVMRKSCSMLKGMGTATGEPVAVKAARRVRKGEVRKGLAEIPPEGCSGGSKRKTVPRWPPTLHGVWAGTVASGLSMGVEPATLTGTDDARGEDTRDRVGTCQGSSSLSRARGKPASAVWALAAGSGIWTCRRAAHEPIRSSCKKTERCAGKPGASLWLSEVRQENAFTQRAVYVASQMDCPHCPLREQCLGRNAKGNRARRISAVRRLLPSPSSVEQDPHLLEAIRWVDVAGRALRRTWIAHWRRKSRRNPSPGRNSRKNLPSTSSSSLDPFSSSLELARPACTQRLVGTTPAACHCRRGSRFSCSQLTQEEAARHPKLFS